MAQSENHVQEKESSTVGINIGICFSYWWPRFQNRRLSFHFKSVSVSTLSRAYRRYVFRKDTSVHF